VAQPRSPKVMNNTKHRILSSVLLAAGCFAILASASGATSNYTAKKDQLGAGLIHWWKFNGNAMDSAGDLDAVPTGPVEYVPAVMGSGILFDGTSTGINLPCVKELMFANSFTISAWAYLKSYPTGSKQLWSSIIFCGDERNGLDPFALQVGHDGKMNFLLTGEHGDATVDTPMPLNRFVLVTATYNRAAALQCLYLNGKLVGQNTDKPNLTPVVSLVADQKPGIGIGTNNAFPESKYNYGWNGVVNDLRIYDRPLTAIEVQELYNLGVRSIKK